MSRKRPHQGALYRTVQDPPGKVPESLGYPVNILHLMGVEKTPTYDELLAEDLAMKAEADAMKANEKPLKTRIAYLERMLYGAKSDRLASQVPAGQLGLFDDLFREAMDEKAGQIRQMAEDMKREAQKRRAAAKKPPVRPSKYRYAGLEERTTTLMPEGIDASACDIIGKDITRILRRDPAKLCGQRHILRPYYYKESRE